jgi:hypothetical protein
MGRKFRSTEVSGNVEINGNGQHTQVTCFCVNCKGLNKKHYSDCPMPNIYTIPSNIEDPKEITSGEIFKKQFASPRLLGWWFKNNNKK